MGRVSSLDRRNPLARPTFHVAQQLIQFLRSNGVYGASRIKGESICTEEVSRGTDCRRLTVRKYVSHIIYVLGPLASVPANAIAEYSENAIPQGPLPLQWVVAPLSLIHFTQKARFQFQQT